jgi:hypothetical protein
MQQTRLTPIDKRACTLDGRGPVSLFRVTLDRRVQSSADKRVWRVKPHRAQLVRATDAGIVF